jgi:hypothetical protein
MFRESQNLAMKFRPDLAVLKSAETGGSARSAPLDHAQMDGVVLAGLQSQAVPSECLKWATISSRLGVRAKSDALEIIRSMPLALGVPQSHLDAIAAAMVGRSN